MKNILLLFLLFFSFALFAQDEYDSDTENEETGLYQRDIKKNELSLNVLNIVIIGAFDVRYERILSQNVSLGLDIFAKVAKGDNEDFDTYDAYYKDFSATGRVKFFFGDRTAWGFYTQGFLMASSGVYDDDDYDETTGAFEGEQEYFDVALGFGVGGKFVSKGGFFTDLSFGLGRNFFSSDSPTLVALLNVDLGYRF